MGIDDRVPYRLGTSKLPPLPINWDLVREPKPLKVREAHQIVNECLSGQPVTFIYIHRQGEKRNTALAMSTYDPVLKDKWHEAIEKLYECLGHEEDLVAEIADYAVVIPNLLPKAITTTEIDLYQVAALIDDHEWMTVDVLGWYSPVHGVRWPTIVITARDAGKESWYSKKIPAVEQFVKDQGLDLEVVLQVLDQLPALPEGEFDRHYHELSSFVYGYVHEIGRSLGIQNVDGSVSLGFQIIVEDGRQFGVTSCRRFQQAGLTQTGLIGLNIQAPSSHDDLHIKKYLPEDDEVEHLQPRDIGKIVAVSSRSLLTDWCLFELDQDEFVRKNRKVWAQIKDGKTYRVKKWGRSTGFTEGAIGASPSILNSKYMEHAQADSPIVAVRCVTSSKDTPFFCPGDNGAFVQEYDSDAILGSCAAYNKASQVSYMTPIAPIIGEINDVLTGKIEEPKEIQVQHDTPLPEEFENFRHAVRLA
ncbi:hypothetical protein EJ04DRAFT_559680 [Polyplosphaeria fusca]|uniref:Uncharacterized protein n=1 Tax=Polyplosphaeria fusca TaxID=682080 RepID=A0A9P4V4P6_9PLEO|nr:hypothetical protein EJ04DRAFT_559680 [Polyplosphaeria fusca]